MSADTEERPQTVQLEHTDEEPHNSYEKHRGKAARLGNALRNLVRGRGRRTEPDHHEAMTQLANGLVDGSVDTGVALQREVGSPRAPIDVQHYEGVDPEDPVFHSGSEARIHVKQGQIRVSYDGKPIETDGIGRCHAAFIRNIDTGAIALGHMEPGINEVDDFRIKTEIGRLGEGQKTAILFAGSTSVVIDDTIGTFERLGIKIEEVVSVDTGGTHWSIAYKPDEDKILVDQRSAKNVLTFRGFQADGEVDGIDTKVQREAVKRIIEAMEGDPEQSRHLLALSIDEQGEYADYLTSLRDKDVVGKDRYGKSVVNSCHHKGESTPEAETAQEHAVGQYREKIDAGLADPSLITTEMYQTLQVTGEIIAPPVSYEEVVPQIAQELQAFVDKGLITESEADVIRGEAEKFSKLYHEGYEDADTAKVFEISRDMARMIAYQTRMDKNVLVGSDHGERHILRGNMKFADQIIASLGDSVSLKDKVLVHAIITMHDIGYTVGAAQSPGGFQASKDHPVAGAEFIAANKEWVADMFGSDAVAVIQESILDHSYVGGDFEAPRPEGSDINSKLVRAITSAVDSLGVTADTKIPAFLNNPAAIGELFKMRLAGIMTGQDEDGNFRSSKQEDRYNEVFAKRKQALKAIAQSTSIGEQQKAFVAAVDSINPRHAEALEQFTGEVTEVRMVRHPDNSQLVPEIKMTMIDELGTQIRDMLGGEAELAQFVKAMEDLGITDEQTERFHRVMESARRDSVTPLEEELTYLSEKARVVVGFKQEVSDEFAEMREVFNEAAIITQKWKIIQKIDTIDPSSTDFADSVTDIVGTLGLISNSLGDGLRKLLTENQGLFIDSLSGPMGRDMITTLQSLLQEDIDKYLLG